MIYYHSPRLQVRWDDKLKIVITEGEGYADGDDLYKGMNAGIELLAKKKSSRWLGDLRFRRAMQEADMVWIAKDWTPRAVAAGMKRLAIVVPTSVLGMMALKRTYEKIEEPTHELRYFDSIEEAQAWLSS